MDKRFQLGVSLTDTLSTSFKSAVFIAASCLLSACYESSDQTNGSETLEAPIIETEYLSAVDTVLLGRLSDASTGEAIGNNATIRIETEDKDKLVNQKGEPLTDGNLTLSNGSLNFSVAEGVELSSENPINIMLIIDAPGYISSSQRIEVTEKGVQPFSVGLVSTAEGQSPVGTSAITLDYIAVANNGLITEEIQVTSPVEESTGIATEITIPGNTQITTREGAPLIGNLSASLVFHNNQDVESLSSLPGGLSDVVVNQGEQEIEGTFVSGGFISFEITDEQGQKAANFSNPIQMATELSPLTINPTTGNSIQAGDTIPVWSYEPSTAEWTFEGDGTVLPASENGNYPIVFSASHLSYYNMDWIFSGDDACATTSPIQIIGNGEKRSIRYQLSLTGGGWTGKAVYDNTDELGFYRVLDNKSMTLTAQLGDKRIEKTFADLCLDEGAEPLTFDVSSLANQNFRDIQFLIDKVACETFDIEIPASTFIQYRGPHSRTYRTSYVEKDSEGNASLLLSDLSEGLAYDVRLVAKGRAFGKDYTKIFDRVLLVNDATGDQVYDLSSYCADVDDDLIVPEVSFVTRSTTAPESAGEQTYSIEVALDDAQQVTESITVQYAIDTASNVNATDFIEPDTKALVFQSGETKKAIDLVIKDDLEPESTYETLVLRLIPDGTLASGKYLTHKVTLVDNDTPVVSFAGGINRRLSAVEGEGVVSFTLELEEAATASFVVNLVSRSWYAEDITVPASIAFEAGEISKTVDVIVVDDDKAESTETFWLQIQRSATDQYIVKNNGAYLTLKDDDARFVKVDANGSDLQSDAASWTCVRDTLKGRIWEVKTAANKHQQFDSLESANTYIDSLNERAFCGLSDWKLPNFYDMYSIKHNAGFTHNGKRLYINMDYFPNAIVNDGALYYATWPSNWWSWSTNIGGYYFNHQRYYGYTYYYLNHSPSSFYLRAVTTVTN